MKSKKMLLPIIVLSIGVLATVAAYLLSSIVKNPVITENDFPFSVTYELGEETKSIQGVVKCSFIKDSESVDPLGRYYDRVFVTDSGSDESNSFTVAETDSEELVLVIDLHADYLMGDPEDPEDVSQEARLWVYDREGVAYDDPEALARFDARIVSWDFPEPIENSLEFSHIIGPWAGSILPMLLVGILTILVSIIFVKKEKDLKYSALDNLSIVLNIAIAVFVIPLSTFVGEFSQLISSNGDPSYLIMCITPAVSALCIAASICLRRKAYSKSGLLVQFIGPVLFALSLIIEAIETTI